MSKSRAATQHGLIPLEIIERRIYFIRTHKVMLDSDLAELYGVTTKRLNEQVKRNIDRYLHGSMDGKYHLKHWGTVAGIIRMSRTSGVTT